MRKVALTSACPHHHILGDSCVTRRGFLGQAIHLGMAMAAASMVLEPQALSSLARAGRAIKFSHGTGLCNLPLFYAAEKDLFDKYGVDDDVVMTPMAGTSAIQLASGQVEMGVIPYTNAIAAYTRSPSFAMVAGSGIQGLILVAKPEIKTFQNLQGKKIGTFQADTLDILVYDYLKQLGLTCQDVQMQCLGDSVELRNAFIAGHLDAISSIEPYATRAKTASDGNILGDGRV
jgi:NitT/TauT family transport system substrate-binding protein